MIYFEKILFKVDNDRLEELITAIYNINLVYFLIVEICLDSDRFENLKFGPVHMRSFSV